MIGLNGGLLGKLRTPTTGAAPGVWATNEQSLAQRAGIWPAPPPTDVDPHWNNVLRLYRFSGQGIADIGPLASNPTQVVDVSLSSGESPFAGSASGYFNGTSSFVSIPVVTVAGSSFTVEFWVKLQELGRIHSILYDTPNLSSKGRVIVSSSNRVIVSNNNEGPTVTSDTWYHIAYVRNNNVDGVYVNGVSTTIGVETVSKSYNRIGSMFDGSSAFWFLKGWLAEMRITGNIARYTTNFAPPTAPFPDA